MFPKRMVVLAVVLFLVTWAGLAFLFHTIVTTVSDVGLKTIVERVWEGKKQ